MGSDHISAGEQQPSDNIKSIKTLNDDGDIEKKNADTTLRVLTLNCWGLWWVAKLRPQRIRGIVRFIRENNCDIVFLQEVWIQSDFEFIKDNTSDIYRFAHHYKSGSLLKTSGIVILSKWQPKVIHFEPYSLNGSPFYFWHGDWFAGKGVAYARVDLDNSVSLHLFSTHTHAYYKENERVHDQYSIHRVCQSYQLGRFINFISDTTCNRKNNSLDLIIVAGDFNCTSSELPYKIVTSMANLTDCVKVSRVNNANNSNIIHAFKVRPSKLRGDTQFVVPEIDCSSYNSSNLSVSDQSSSFRTKNEGFSLEEYRKKIVHLLFDSDTEDEDSTYCHPKNSFTGWRNNLHSSKKSTLVNSASNIMLNQELSHSKSSFVSADESSSKVADSSSSSEPTQSENNGIAKSDIDGRNQGDESPKKMLSKINSNNNIYKTKKKSGHMKRIDFILCRLLTHGRCIIDRISVEGKDSQLACSLSDHEPVMVELKISHHNENQFKRSNLSSSDTRSNNNNNDTSIGAAHGRAFHIPDSAERSRVEQTNKQLAKTLEIRSNINSIGSTVDRDIDNIDSDHQSQLHETTGRITPANHFSINETYNEHSLKVLEQFQDILKHYYRFNGRHKFRCFIFILFVCITTMPLLSYYAVSKDMLPASSIVLMWLFALLIISVGTLVGFISHRIEQSAIEATLNDVGCRINVAKIKQI